MTLESTHFQTMRVEWLGSDDAYVVETDGETVLRSLPGGWMVEVGMGDFEVCGAVNVHLTCMARKYHEHPHVGCVVPYQWTDGLKITSVSLKRLPVDNAKEFRTIQT